MTVKPNKFLVLGVNCAHDASACLLLDNRIEFAILEERLTRIKHQDGYPLKAIQYCLESANIRNISDLDAIVVNRYPTQKRFPHIKSPYCICKVCAPNKIINPSHHLLHAYHAWTASGFKDTVIMVADGSGYSYGEYLRRGSPLLGTPPPFSEMEEAETIFYVVDDDIHLLYRRWGLWIEKCRERYRFDSLGHMYSAVSQYIFGHWTHGGKTMGLASYGDPQSVPFDIVSIEDGAIKIDTSWPFKLPNQIIDKSNIEKKYHTHQCRNLAAKVQYELEKALQFLANKAFDETGCENLCIVGGVGLNSAANGKLQKSSPFSKVFVAPSPSDGGVAIGAAYFGYRNKSKSFALVKGYDVFLGKEYTDQNIIDAISCFPGLKYERCKYIVESASRDISEGKVVGWFEGRSEFGPRALGHRSILADPRVKEMKDKLNQSIKFREKFRPFAASVLSEKACEYFKIHGNSDFMSFVSEIVPEKLSEIPAVTHIDGTCRVQTVDKNYKGLYRKLIEQFDRITGVPLILNTSFNVREEPIVESPLDALNCFLGSGIEVLYFSDIRVTKRTKALTPSTFDELILYINSHIKLICEHEGNGIGLMAPTYSVITRTGLKICICALQKEILCFSDGNLSIKDIYHQCLNIGIAADISSFIDSVKMLLSKGVVRLVDNYGST